MKNKLSCALICISLIITVLSSMMVRSAADIYGDKRDLSVNVDILDQEQIQHNHESSIHSSVWIAQSFKPSMTPLIKIELNIRKPVVIERPFDISIRKDLIGADLTYTSVPSTQIPYYTHWIEFDFPDIEVEIDKTYYMVVRTSSPPGESYRWLDEYNSEDDSYERGKQWQSIDYGGTWTNTESGSFYTDSTFRTYSYASHPDLGCTGFFNWTDVKQGETVTGSFIVENIGTPFSYLDWKILQWPNWGIWSFTQLNGSRLKPEDGAVNIQVSVEAPHSDIPDEYYGEIRIINENNPDDYCTINVRLVTPKNKNTVSSQSFQFLKEIIQNFPFFQWLLESCPSR